MNDELKPCPFCGGKPKLGHSSGSWGYYAAQKDVDVPERQRGESIGDWAKRTYELQNAHIQPMTDGGRHSPECITEHVAATGQEEPVSAFNLDRLSLSERAAKDTGSGCDIKRCVILLDANGKELAHSKPTPEVVAALTSLVARYNTATDFMGAAMCEKLATHILGGTKGAQTGRTSSNAAHTWDEEGDHCTKCGDPVCTEAKLSQLLPGWFESFLLNVCELPDRNSPEDEPDAIVASLAELRSCAISAIEAHVPGHRVKMSAVSYAKYAKDGELIEARIHSPEGKPCDVVPRDPRIEDLARERDEADRLNGQLIRQAQRAEEEIVKRRAWIREAKKRAGFEDSDSFDLVFDSLLVSQMPPLQRRALRLVLDVTNAAFHAMDDSEERAEEVVISKDDYEALCATLDAIENELPDDRPGYTMDAPGRARWALRKQSGEFFAEDPDRNPPPMTPATHGG